MKTILGQITEEFGELGKKIVKETVKVPVDIVMPKQQDPKQPEQKKEQSEIAPRQWLEMKSKGEPSIFERKNMEEQEKKETVKKQAEAAAWEQLPQTGSAPRRGDLRNVSKKQAGTETGKNIMNQ